MRELIRTSSSYGSASWMAAWNRWPWSGDGFEPCWRNALMACWDICCIIAEYWSRGRMCRTSCSAEGRVVPAAEAAADTAIARRKERIGRMWSPRPAVTTDDEAAAWKPSGDERAPLTSLSERVDDIHASVLEVVRVASRDGQPMDKRRRRDQAVLDRHRPAGPPEIGQ